MRLRSLDPGGGADSAVTGRRGEARFLDLAAGRYAYEVEAPDRPQPASAGSVELEESEWKDVRVRLVVEGLTLSGRVLTGQGEPVAGIQIEAARHRFASSVEEAAPGDRSPRTARSRDDGSFEIPGLTEGEYDVATRATPRYAPAKALIRAGSAPVDLVLREGVRVHGSVVDTRGQGLAGVHVRAEGPAQAFAYTDARGDYQLYLEREAADEGELYTLHFYLRGYQQTDLPLPPPGSDGMRELRLDAELEALEDAARVTGVVESERGEGIAGASIFLSNPQGSRYQALSDADGSFSLDNVEIGPNYRLSVLAPVPFADYSDQGISVTDRGASLAIVLESIPTGRLTGRMLDADGEPLPGHRLWLSNQASVRGALPISSDERGYFELEEAPAGSLRFDTRASPRLRVSGVTLPADGEADVTLVLDSGDLEMLGEVLDERGDPVAGAEVSLSWSHTSTGLQSRSERATRTDATGTFRFTRLGPGEHLLEVQATGYRSLQKHWDVGPYAAELELRLEPDRP